MPIVSSMLLSTVALYCSVSAFCLLCLLAERQHKKARAKHRKERQQAIADNKAKQATE